MPFRSLLLRILLIYIFLPGIIYANGQGFSYVYIQGDKQVPFYVKLEDQMLPRYGKNHSIIAQLAPGPIHIQILFQQNMYPPQKFAIHVPENGFRGFLLMRKGDNFTLYDVQQQFYLPAGNSIEDDRAPVNNPAAGYVYRSMQQPATIYDQPGQPVQKYNKNTVATGNNGQNNGSGTPRFIANIELSNERTVQNKGGEYTPPPNMSNDEQEEPIPEEEPTTQEPVMTTPPPVQTKEVNEQLAARREDVGYRGSIINSDCPTPLSGDDFDDIYRKASGKNDKVRLKYLLSEMDKCYTTGQARVLAQVLENDPERYTLLKRIYPRITDQSLFPELENLLSTQEWKGYFKLILTK